MFELIVDDNDIFFFTFVKRVCGFAYCKLVDVDSSQDTIFDISVENASIWIKYHALSAYDSIFPMSNHELIVDCEQHPHSMR